MNDNLQNKMRALALTAILFTLSVCQACRNPVTSLNDFKSEIRLIGYAKLDAPDKPGAGEILEQALSAAKLDWTRQDASSEQQTEAIHYKVSLLKSGMVSMSISIELINASPDKDPRFVLSAGELPYNMLRYANRVHRKLVKSLKNELHTYDSVRVKGQVIIGKAEPIIPPGTQIW